MQNTDLQSQTKTNLAKKEPSILGSLILIITIITIYSHGIYLINNAVTDIIKAVAEQVDLDNEFKIFNF